MSACGAGHVKDQIRRTADRITIVAETSPTNAAVRPYLNTAQAAHYLGIGWRKLMRLRVAGKGPRFRKHGRLIFYHMDDLDAWSLSASRGTT